MSARAHLRLFLTATGVWAAFFAAGLPDYYQQYSARSLAVFEVALLAPVGVAAWLTLRRRRRVPRMHRALALAFHFTVPLLVYDALYCGVHLGHGVAFLGRYWYLTTYYFVPWLVFPAIAAWLDRTRDARSAAAEDRPRERAAR